jgi:hypothetical protein
MRDGKFSVPAATHQDRQYYKELERAFIRYPVKPNDLPMAVWLAFGMMQEVWEMYAKTGVYYLAGREDRLPAYMIENPVRFDLELAVPVE